MVMGQSSRILQILHVVALVLGASSLPTNIRGSSTYLLNSDNDLHVSMQADAKSTHVLEPPAQESSKVDKSIVDQMENTLAKSSMANMSSAELKEHTLEPHATKWLCIWSDTFCFPTVIEKARWLWVASMHRSIRSQEVGSVVFSTCVVVATCAVFGVLFMMLHGESAEEEQGAKSYHEFWALRFSEGTWAQTLQNADGPQKEALELLFRSSIIPRTEFAFEQVNAELIKDRIEIAQQMLKQKSLEKWLGSPKQAKVAFDDSVAKEIRADRQQSSSPNVLQALRRDPRDPRTDSNVPALASSHLQQQLIDNVAISRSTPPPSRTIASSRDDGGRNALLMRCREIMKDTERGRPAGQVWRSAPQLSSTASTAPAATASTAPAASPPLKPDSPQLASEDQIVELDVTTSRSSVL